MFPSENKQFRYLDTNTDNILALCFFEVFNSLVEFINNMFGLLDKPLDDSNKTTKTILEALEITGQRGIVDRGWGDLGKCKYHFAGSISWCFFLLPPSYPHLFTKFMLSSK